MQGFILGTKIKNAQIFTEKGERIPVVYINTNPSYFIGIKTPEKDGYFAAILGFGKAKRNKKPVTGKLKKVNITESLAFIKEIRLDANSISLIEKEGRQGLSIKPIEGTVEAKEIFVGDKITPTVFFTPGNLVTVTGVSKGKGFAGAVKRHHFAGFPASHGHPHQRVPGSIGSATTPGRVLKGLRMAGRMGSETVTIKNLEVVEVLEDKIVIKGMTPGPRGTFLSLVSSK
jgi:large subunit ribosomal protein L3